MPTPLWTPSEAFKQASGLAAYMRWLAEKRGLVFDDILDEFDRTVRMVLLVVESDQLLEKEPVLRRSIKVRNPYVDPMNYIQVALLQSLQTDVDDEQRGKLTAAVLGSVNGIAAGLQNTG